MAQKVVMVIVVAELVEDLLMVYYRHILWWIFGCGSVEKLC